MTTSARHARIALAACALLATPASADSLDEFGFGGAAAATAGARMATATGAPAAHHNPAGVALGEHPSLLIGWSVGSMMLEINDRDAAVLAPHGASIGLAIPFQLSDEWRMGIGTALYLPDQFLARVQLIPLSEPHFILLDNDPHRAVSESALSLAYRDVFAFGVGASLLADARGNQLVFDVGIVAGEKVGQSALDVELPARLAPIVSAWFRPHPRVRTALLYRGELALDLLLDILANVEVAGVVTGDVLVSIRATNYFTPARFGGGIAVDLTPDLTLETDLTWNQWSHYPPAPDLAVLVALDLQPPLVTTPPPPSNFTDTLSGRIGIEYRRPGRTEIAGRAGAAWIPSPVPLQSGLTNYADGDRRVLSAGVGIRLADWAPILTRPIDFDVAMQWHSVAHQRTIKQPPGQAFSSGGNILHATASATVNF